VEFDWLSAWQSVVVCGIPVTLIGAFVAASEDYDFTALLLGAMFFVLVFIAGGIPWEVV